MKQKISFRRFLLPFRKQLKMDQIRAQYAKDPELFYAVGLILLWLAVFIFIHIKH
jgi:hypothetical protein